MNETDAKSAALDFLKNQKVGVLATLAPDGHPRARTLYFATNEAFEIFFMTLAGTRKIEDIAANERAAFVVSDTETPRTLQLEGAITELTDSTVIDSTLSNLVATFMAHGSHFAPLTHLNSGTVSYYKLTPSWIRFGDFARGEGNGNVFSIITA